MKVKMLRNTIIDGKVAYAGKVVDVKKSDLPGLLHYGKAELYEKGEKKAKRVETATDEPKEKAVSRSNESKKDK